MTRNRPKPSGESWISAHVQFSVKNPQEGEQRTEGYTIGKEQPGTFETMARTILQCLFEFYVITYKWSLEHQREVLKKFHKEFGELIEHLEKPEKPGKPEKPENEPVA